MESSKSEIPTLVVAPQIPNIGVARRFVVSAVDEHLRRPELEVLTSEVVANAVTHAGTDVTVQVQSSHGRARVEVHDGSAELPEMQIPGAALRTGRGLAIVDALADDWGYWPVDGNGKVVWFELGPEQAAD
jgi:anti-sigma regulatory factor (Ser/Thr protein kinase)